MSISRGFFREVNDDEQNILEPAAHPQWRERWRRWRQRLQVRMTLSFVGATVLSLLLLEFVFVSITFILIQHQSILNIMRVLLSLVASGLFWALVAAPAGVLFGLLTTRSIIRRIGRLVDATARFADGDYASGCRKRHLTRSGSWSGNLIAWRSN
jgi:hypothetical protein